MRVEAPQRPRSPTANRRWAGAGLVIAAMAWSVSSTDIGIGSLVDGRAGAMRLVGGLVSPDFSGAFLGTVASAAVETVHISLAGLLLSTVAGFPLAVLIARNVEAPLAARRLARFTATVLRGVPELLWALIFVATVGLGPAAGVYALALHGAGLLAKLCSEQLEAVDPAPVEAVRFTGASRLATTLLAIVPQARSQLVSVLLYQWECNIRTATVVGFVGAGGIGQSLDISLRLFRYGELSTLVLTVLALIVVVDQLSRLARRGVGAAA